MQMRSGGRLAQLVEHLVYTERVGGSSPSAPTTHQEGPVVPIPSGAPQTLRDAFAHINAVTAPTLTDLKVMVLVEAAGQTLYEVSAEGTSHEGVKALLIANGREEMKHAGRMSAAIKAISGEDFPPPLAADNPYLVDEIPRAELSVDGLTKTAQAEFAGEALYAGWATSMANAEAAELMRLNGKEEADHGNRLMEAAALLG
jgi:rubrerythrin